MCESPGQWAEKLKIRFKGINKTVFYNSFFRLFDVTGIMDYT